MDFTPSVFLSFTMEDTGRTFVSHLQRSLDKKGIRTYKENQNRGDGRISREVASAIRDSNVAVVVISENYASSVWCLDVLAEIIEHSRFSFEMTIKTMFYEVDPEDLTRPTGKFADDLRRHEERENSEAVSRWSTSEDDSKMLDDLIISISTPRFRRHRKRVPRSSGVERKSKHLRLESDAYMKHLPNILSVSQEAGLERDSHHNQDDDMPTESPPPADSNGLVGMLRHKKAVYGLLDLESNNSVRTIGIWGAEGVGKTTLAECVFDDISPHFQHHCFITNVDNIYHKRISPSLLKHLTRRTRSPSDIFAAIKPSLVNRTVLLVVDGVDNKHNEQFKDVMMLIRWLGPGSRVIMTSDDDHPLDSRGVKYLYHMECPRYDEALQLFSTFAFKQTYPLTGFEGLSIRAVHFAGRLPLALKALGSILYDKDEETWKRTLRKLEASQDNGSRQISNYIAAGEYLPRRQTEVEHYVRADEEDKHSSSYHMLL